MANRPSKRQREAKARLQTLLQRRSNDWLEETQCPSEKDVVLANILVNVKCRRCGMDAGELTFWDDPDDLFLIQPWNPHEYPTDYTDERRLRGNQTVEARCLRQAHPPLILATAYLRALMSEARRNGKSITIRR